MDLSGILSSVGGSSGGGGGSNWGAGLAIGGMAEQDIASFLASAISSKKQRAAIAGAEEKLNQGYDAAGNALSTGYGQSRSDISTGTTKAVSALDAAYNSAVAAQQPYTQAGKQGTAILGSLGEFSFDSSSVDVTQDPGYQFRQTEGQKVIESSAAARGGQLSGATMKALQKYSQDLASQEYGTAYNRAYTAAKDTYESKYNLGTTLSGLGQSAANQVGQYGMSAGTNLANLYNTEGQNLSGLASAYGTNTANLSVQQAQNLADLQLMRGNVNAAEWQGYGNAAVQQGQHLQQIGMGQLGYGAG